MRLSRGVTMTACVAALLLGVTACDSGSKSGTSSGSGGPVRLYGTDGNMSNSFGDEFKTEPGMLSGMKGTTPLTRLSDDFKRRLRSIEPKLNDFTYSAESYDAVVISALAAESAGSTDPKEIAKYINGVTAGGQECDTVTLCLSLARAGTDLQYRGVSLRRGGFTDAGEPSTASYATLHFDANDRLDDGKTEYVGAGDETTTTTTPPPAPHPVKPGVGTAKIGPLKIGGLLPQTGDLALADPPMETAVKLAIKEINAAGGVFDQPVVWIPGDDGTNPTVALKTVQQHITEGVQVMIGAAASGVTRAVLPAVVQAGLILFSPSNTAADLSTADDKGLYFRTAPSDLLQGKALADVILRDGAQRIVIAARADAYGEGLQHNTNDDLLKAGLAQGQIKLLTYKPQDGTGPKPDMAGLATQIKSFGPDGVLVIGFGESADLIKALSSAGVQLRH
jgi:ABC-type branched-subunit amino acid transport system substrate-binding protein